MIRASFFLCVVLTLPCLIVAMLFDVKRYSSVSKDGNEPYIPTNVFVNKDKRRSICLFMYCWKHHANCLTAADCCSCKCRNSSTFFSEPLGCKERHNITATAFSRGVEKTCAFTTLKFGFDYVPLFNEASRFSSIELVLPHHRNFPLHSDSTVCRTGGLYEYDYHGHKRLIHRNGCSELFSVDRSSGKKLLSFISMNETLWNMLRGRLLSLKVSCVLQGVNFSSCFLFQVEGKYVEELHKDGDVEALIPSTCSKTEKHQTTQTIVTTTTTPASMTTAATTTTTASPSTTTSTTARASTREPSESTISSSLVLSSGAQHTSSYATQRSFPLTTSKLRLPLKSKTEVMILTTATSLYIYPVKDSGTEGVVPSDEANPTVTVVYVQDTLTGTTIGVLTGLGTGIAIVMVCIIIWIFVKKRTNLFKTPPRSSGNTPIFNPQGGNTPFDVASFHYDIPSSNIAQPIPLLPHSPPQTPLTTTTTLERDSYPSRAYSSRRNPAMSMRPLPNGDTCTLDRQYSSIVERTDFEDGQDYENHENTVLLKGDVAESIGYGRQYSSISERDHQGYEEPVRSCEDVGVHSQHGSLNSRGANRKNRDTNRRPTAENLSYGRQYSYISSGKCDVVDLPESKDFDGCSTLTSRGSSKMGGCMSNRPLPEKPMESVNQYYSVVSLGSDKSDKISEGNDLYSLYSTIDDLQHQ